MKELEECLWCDTISGVQGQVGSDEERGAGRLHSQMLSVGAKEVLNFNMDLTYKIWATPSTRLF